MLPHLIKIPGDRASSSFMFLKFLSASSEGIKYSFTSSAVISPVVSSGVSMLLLGESTGVGEKEACSSSGDRSLHAGEWLA